MRVLTWNLWWKFGPWQERQSAIEAEITAVGPDLVFLQEVYADNEEDQAERLATLLGFSFARSAIEGTPHRFGNAILSRWPIQKAVTLSLPDPSGTSPHRTAVFAEISRPEGLQLVVCTHLEWRYDQSDTRSRQLEAVCVAVDQWMKKADEEDSIVLPVLIGGDLNAVPHSDEIRRLTGVSQPFVPGLVFTDSWSATNTDAGYTWVRENVHARDAQWPNRRLDYLLVSWPRSKPQMNPLRSELRGVTSFQDVLPSDHYAVLVDFDDRQPFDRSEQA